MSEITNADRAEWAEECIEQFSAHVGPPDLDVAAGDLVTNILHWMRLNKHVEADDLENWLQARLNMHDQEMREDEKKFRVRIIPQSKDALGCTVAVLSPVAANCWAVIVQRNITDEIVFDGDYDSEEVATTVASALVKAYDAEEDFD